MQKKLRYWVGTSGWQYDHWRGRFYPGGMPKAQWFKHYAATFSCVEVNNSFYRQPSNATWDRWHDAAPEGFRFAVKANRYITHMKRFKDCEEPLKRFLNGAERLRDVLGPLLYQTPPGFECDERNLHRLDGFLKLLPGQMKHVFEFRHPSWFGDEGLNLLRNHGVSLCVQDIEEMKCPVVATAAHAYFRFHGIGQLYKGNYSEDALETWARRIASLEGVEEVWAFFNNDLGGHAIGNALRLRELLGAHESTEER